MTVSNKMRLFSGQISTRGRKCDYKKVALVFRRLLVSEEKRKVPFLASADVLYCAITKCQVMTS